MDSVLLPAEIPQFTNKCIISIRPELSIKSL